MDQDYERRLLRQIVIQNENTMPCVRDSVTSVGWSERGNLVAVGTHKGFVQIWDAAAGKKLSMLEGHTARVGALAWNADQLSSGSRDRMILQRDIRTPPLQSERRLQGHRQEVCGLKWSTDHQLLASGGNDNKLLVWNHSSLSPVQQYTEHLAAVKAIAWSPHQHGLLASGGGTADRCIRFWNTLTGQPLQCIDTGSQVCNLAWSKHANELVSTHGYSQNQILVWKYPSLTQVAKLTGHSYRVLYLAMSPDGEAIVTGAGDETLRFWNVFSKTRSTKVKWVGISASCPPARPLGLSPGRPPPPSAPLISPRGSPWVPCPSAPAWLCTPSHIAWGPQGLVTPHLGRWEAAHPSPLARSLGFPLG
uniref:Fizzy and cell division cycle 20 related 1 n=1 Tax=Equus asinus asinus TaxID=83772 RepID=A0A8C4N6D0_EQUAS